MLNYFSDSSRRIRFMEKADIILIKPFYEYKIIDRLCMWYSTSQYIKMVEKNLREIEYEKNNIICSYYYPKIDKLSHIQIRNKYLLKLGILNNL